MRADPIAADEIRTFFSDVAAAFACAAERAGTRTIDYLVGGRIMRLEFAGDALREAFTRATAHLETPARPAADLHVHLWEIAETGVMLPRPRWDLDAYLRRGEIQGFNDGTRFTLYHPDSRTLFLYDAARGHAYVCVFGEQALPAYERASPLRPILFPWLATFNTQYVHAAAVGLPAGGALLVGKSGAGKSTTSLACLDSELLFAGDDYCAIRIDDNPRIYGLYSSGKASDETIARLPFLESHIRFWDKGGSGKAIFFFNETLPIKLIREFPLRAILIPRVTGERACRVTPALPRTALLALAPSTMSQLATADGRVLKRLAELVRRVPCWNLELGVEIKQIPTTIARLLEQPLHAS